MSDESTSNTDERQPAVGARLEPGVGRLEPERDIADYEYGDEDWLDDKPVCERGHGDGMDPMTDYLMPCPACQGEQR